MKNDNDNLPKDGKRPTEINKEVKVKINPNEPEQKEQPKSSSNESTPEQTSTAVNQQKRAIPQQSRRQETQNNPSQNVSAQPQRQAPQQDLSRAPNRNAPANERKQGMERNYSPISKAPSGQERLNNGVPVTGASQPQAPNNNSSNETGRPSTAESTQKGNPSNEKTFNKGQKPDKTEAIKGNAQPSGGNKGGTKVSGAPGAKNPGASPNKNLPMPGASPNKNLPIPGASKNPLASSIKDKVSENSTLQDIKKITDNIKKVGNVAQKVGKGIQGTFQGLVSLLSNPVSWIVLLVIIVAIFFYASVLVLGKDTDNCDTNVTGSSVLNWPGDDASVEEKGKAIGCFLLSQPVINNNNRPMNAEQAGAVVGIMIAETSTLNPKLIQNGAGPGPNATNAQMKAFVNGHTDSNMGAIGMFQHRKERAMRMIEIAESTGRQWNDAQVQIEHYMEEMNSNTPNSRNLAANGFWKDGQTVQYYSDLFNRFYTVSCRWHTDEDKRGCREPISDPRGAGRRAVENGEKFAEMIKSGCSGGRTSTTSTSSTITEGATTTQFPGQEGLKPHTLEYAKHIGEKFGLATIGGYRPVDAYPDHPSGLALDIMVTQKETGDAIAQYFIDNEDAFAPVYMIWSQRYYNFPKGGRSPVSQWKQMEDRGSSTANHMDHVHILFKETPGTGNWRDGTSAGTCGATEAAGTGDWVIPACGIYTSGYGMRYNPGQYFSGQYRLHAGMDIGGNEGQDVKAAKGGVVSLVKLDPTGLGNYVVINHEDVNKMTVYGHMISGSVVVTEGQKVNSGDLIGKVGDTGNVSGAHLHFQVHEGSDGVFSNNNSIDPALILTEANLGPFTINQEVCRAQ